MACDQCAVALHLCLPGIQLIIELTYYNIMLYVKVCEYLQARAYKRI